MSELPWLAHSARAERQIPAQEYGDHIAHVAARAVAAMSEANAYRTGGASDKLMAAVRWAATFHDLGKLEDENQAVLRSNERKGLPVPHEDAGSAHCLRHGQRAAAWAIQSHHQGLTSYPEESLKDDQAQQHPELAAFRDGTIKLRTDKCLEVLVQRHDSIIGCPLPPSKPMGELGAWPMRLLLSSLVAGDHGDTASNYGQEPELDIPAPRWAERLAKLDEYVSGLGQIASSRNVLRESIYAACRSCSPDKPVWACDAPVGTGKTTAVMAYLLHAADALGLRRIFVVLPYTNIIEQSVKTYRAALVLEGEDPEAIVAAHHHATEFATPELRALTTTWSSPIIVTTAVQFFETLAASATPRLRKLHALPGSAVFIDEAHAAMPLKLWPYMWQQLNRLANNWSCRFVLGSGSLPRFWENSRLFGGSPVSLPSMIPADIATTGSAEERERVRIRSYDRPHTLDSLSEWIEGFPGARLVVMNTVQSAAELAHALRSRGLLTLHLSTALTPNDRKGVLKQVVNFLKAENRPEGGWVLVATSCIEAGVDVSFNTAFRERSSVSSLIQISGRANRHGGPAADVWDFAVCDSLLPNNPSLAAGIRVVADAFENQRWGMNLTDLMTWAINEEWMLAAADRFVEDLSVLERSGDFPEVAKRTKLISDETSLAVVEPWLVNELRAGRFVSRTKLTGGSVAVRRYVLNKVAAAAIPGSLDLYFWPDGGYDPGFLGYMKQLRTMAAIERDGIAFA